MYVQGMCRSDVHMTASSYVSIEADRIPLENDPKPMDLKVRKLKQVHSMPWLTCMATWKTMDVFISLMYRF
jgi:hypothetical protein